MPKKSLNNRAKTAIICFATAAVLLALVCVGGVFFRGKAYYYSASLLIIAAVCVPFFISFERKRPSARELVVLACMTALAVASRAAFFALPTIKPLCAIVIITAASLGAQTGFICGVLSMFASNFIFGQGPWTPFQMLAVGAVGFIADLIFYNRNFRKNRLILTAVGGLLCFAVYGLIVDISSVLMMATEFSIKQILAIYAAGAWFNFTHAAATAAVLLIAGKAFIEQLDRIRVKYDMFGGAEQ